MRKKPETVDNTINQGVISIVTFLKKMSDDTDFLKLSVEEIRDSERQYLSIIEALKTNLELYFKRTDVGLKKKTKNEIANSDYTEKLINIQETLDNIAKGDFYNKISSIENTLTEIRNNLRNQKTVGAPTKITEGKLLVDKMSSIEVLVQNIYSELKKKSKSNAPIENTLTEIRNNLRNQKTVGAPTKITEGKLLVDKMSSIEVLVQNIYSELKKKSKSNAPIENTLTEIRNNLRNQKTVGAPTKITEGKLLVDKMSSIEVLVQNIYSELKKKSKSNASAGTEVTKINTSNIESMAKSLSNLSNTVSRKTNVALRRYIRLMNTLTSKEMAQQVKVSAASFTDLAKQLSTIGTGLEKADEHMKKFMKQLTVFTMFMLSKNFARGTKALQNLMDIINRPRRAINVSANRTAANWKYVFATLALGVAAITVALMNLDKVNWVAAKYLLGFIIGISLAMFIGTRNFKNVTNIQHLGRKAIIGSNNRQSFSLNNRQNLGLQMLALAVGLSVLIVAVDAIREVDWIEAGKLVAFLLAIQTILVVSSLIIGRKGNINGGGMLGFALGLAILLLAIDAGAEIFQGSIETNGTWDPTKWNVSPVWGVVAFILLFTMVFALTGRGSGGVAAHMLKFALGISILLIAIWAGEELFKDSFKIPSNFMDLSKWTVSPVWGVVAFILAVTIALGAFKVGTGKGGAAAHMIAFALGIAGIIAVLVWAEGELKDVSSKKLLSDISIMTGAIYAIGAFVKVFSLMMKGVNRRRLRGDLLNVLMVVGIGVALFTAVAAVQKYIGTDEKKILGAFGIIIGVMFISATGLGALSYAIKTLGLTKTNLNNAFMVMLKAEAIIGIGVVIYGAIAAIQKYMDADNSKILGATQIMMLTILESVMLIGLVVYAIKTLKLTKPKLTEALVVILASEGIISVSALIYGYIAYVQQKYASDNSKILGATQIMMLTILEVLLFIGVVTALMNTGVVNPVSLAFGAIFVAAAVGITYLAMLVYKHIAKTIKETGADNGKILGATQIMMLSILEVLGMMGVVGAIAITGIGAAVMALGTAFLLAGVEIIKIAGEAFWYIGHAEIDTRKNKVFQESLESVIKMFTGFTKKDWKAMRKAGNSAKPVVEVALGMAHVLKELEGVDVSKESIQNFTKIVVEFVNEFAQTMEEASSEALRKITYSGKSLSVIVDTAKGFVDVLIAISNGKIGKYEVDPVTGQPKLVDFEKFDLDSVSVDAGQKLGKLMADFASAYAGALEMSRKEAKRASRASEVLAGLSPVFETVANLVSDVEKTKFLTDESLMTSISKNMQNFVLESKVTLQHINGLDVKQEKFKLFKDLVQTFTQDIKWELAIKNTDRFGESVGTVVKNINGLDLKKAIQMQNIVDSFTKMSNLKGLRDQIKEMTEMLKELNRYNENISESALNVSKQSEQAVKNQEATNELVKNLGNGAVTTQDLHNVVNQIVTNMVTEILKGIGANTYDVNVKNRVKIDDKSY